ncbi:MAG: FtsX-like permease family protein [Tepidisphaeraceae bacterium]
MNLFQIVFKQMRQRALSTWLTLLSVLLGVALAIAILIVQREGKALFGQSDFGYDAIIGPAKGSPLQVTLNTVYHLDQSPGLVPYSVFTEMTTGRNDLRQWTKLAVPFVVGDSFQGRRIVGTSTKMFGLNEDGTPMDAPFEYRRDHRYELVQGRVFAAKKFEAVVGADVAEQLKLKLYDPKLSDVENEKAGGAFRVTHGMPGPNEVPDIHKPIWRIVGILKPTHTANDRVLFVPYVSLFAISEHESGMVDQALLKAKIDPAKVPPEQLPEVLKKLGIDPADVPESFRKKFRMVAPAPKPEAHDDHDHDHDHASTEPATASDEHDHGDEPEGFSLDADGNITPDLPESEWSLSAILVRSRGGFQLQNLLYHFKVIDDRAVCVNPASVMRDFFNTFLSGSTTLLLMIALLVIVVAAISIMTTIYNAVSARLREIAILRASGATRGRILAIICTEAMLIGLFGGVLGLLAGHGIAAVGSVYAERALGESINWLSVSTIEIACIVGVVVLAFIAGLVPAMKAYRTPVASNLVAGG